MRAFRAGDTGLPSNANAAEQYAFAQNKIKTDQAQMKAQEQARAQLAQAQKVYTPAMPPRQGGFGSYVASVPVGGNTGSPVSQYLAQVGNNGIPTGGIGGGLPVTNSSVPIGAGSQGPPGGAARSSVPALARGGVPHFLDAGSPSQWRRKAMQHGDMTHNSGLFPGNGPGRTDNLPVNVPVDSHVIPADVVSGLGEGNTQAGSAIIDKMMNSLPYDVEKLGAAHGGAHSGRLPSAYQEPTPNVNSGFAGGGRPSHTKIIAASGEYLVPPAKVAALGGGDMDKGHKIIDAFIMKVRNKTKKELRKLKPPKK